MKATRAWLPLGLAGVALGLCSSEQWATEPITLQFPVRCEIGKTCEIQNYVDRDPSSEASDYQCGSLTYDKHNGTDVRLPSLAVQRAGVEVLAAAPGVVARVRDGVPDISVRESGSDASGKECGNGVVLEHGQGWETQYCHMEQGSVRVRPGERIAVGDVIGRIGLSGETEYPHLHFTVRHNGTMVDPFAFGAPLGSCGQGISLWAEAANATSYKPRVVLNAGFTTVPLTMKAIEEGELPKPEGRDAPAIVAYIRTIGLKQGDVEELTVKAPDGTVLATTKTKMLDRNKAQTLLFAGRKRPPQGFPTGSYTANYLVARDSTIVLSREWRLQL